MIRYDANLKNYDRAKAMEYFTNFKIYKLRNKIYILQQLRMYWQGKFGKYKIKEKIWNCI